MWLILLSFIYLALPLTIFYTFWLKTVYFLPLVTTILIQAYFITQLKLSISLPKAPFLVILSFFSICFLWLFLGGSGSFVAQNGDWKKHNFILVDLVKKPWPVAYQIDFVPQVNLTYYLGWYLVPALLGKLTDSLLVARYTQLIYSFLGLGLVFSWFSLIFKKFSFTKLFSFIFFSSPDILGAYFVGRSGWVNLVQSVENWSYWGLQYSSFTTLLYYVPGQAIACWLVGLIIFYLITNRRDKMASFLLFSLAPVIFFWSPLGTLGLIVFILPLKEHMFKQKLFALLGLPNILVLCLYYKPNLFQNLYGSSFNGFSPELIGKIPFYLFEVVPLVFILGYLHRRLEVNLKLVVSIIIFLLILPFFKFGLYNDLVMRASIIPLLLTFIFLFQFFNKLPRALKYFLVIFLAFGAYTPFVEFKNALTRPATSEFTLNLNTFAIPEVAQQYLGYGSSFFSQKLMRSPAYIGDYRLNTKPTQQ